MLAIFIALFNFYFWKKDSSNSKVDLEKVKKVALSYSKAEYDSNAVRNKELHSNTDARVWDKKSFRKNLDKLEDAVEIKQKKLLGQAQEIVKDELDNILDLKKYPYLKKCRGTIAYRELSWSIMKIINNNGITTEDYLNNKNIIHNFKEYLTDTGINEKNIVDACAPFLSMDEKNDYYAQYRKPASGNEQPSFENPNEDPYEEDDKENDRQEDFNIDKEQDYDDNQDEDDSYDEHEYDKGYEGDSH